MELRREIFANFAVVVLFLLPFPAFCVYKLPIRSPIHIEFVLGLQAFTYLFAECIKTSDVGDTETVEDLKMLDGDGS